MNPMMRPNKRPVPWGEIKLLILDCDGVLTNGKIIYGSDGQDIKQFNAADGMGLILIREISTRVAVVSGRSSEALQRRCQDLKIEHLYQGIDNKLECVTKLLEELGLTFDNVIYMGDDWNDVPCIRRAALGVVPANAWPEVQKTADMVTERRGGEGAVRELINLILHKKGVYDSAIRNYLESVGCK
ncbi:MAG: HAD hydrolase family protein [Candidatus Cloacimonetes bacterium]|jgi:3-deoxy-D-manno-octulosonate 8-phosphate phosphatase (KDO 8-P phosphatase)|nr:HAD hydrolase family protein [Candidatus Cloacimonadota bacterium]MDD2505710.1 HAD hydrolase family protein [Candidatus Cloacimonadota bacterium]MDD4559132.1 HAD hydrolase family protein [Candidatus Cloacimonadota bacterium]